jgi:sugar O-acyltransferase (sialic acid O-acetyltransferase NeuD family)
VIKNFETARQFIQKEDNRFVLAVGNPILRKKLCNKFESIGGVLSSTISPLSTIGHFDVVIGNGCNIMAGSIVSNSVSIGKGVIVYFNSIVTHDVSIGDFCEISPGAKLLGRCKIGEYTQIGANATILPNIIVGNNVIVGAGAVVTKDVPDNSLMVGIPAKIIKKLNPFHFE